ncbi:hypothetical protein [Mycolicibacterium sarraceniae]|uniref:hypothetical protein n=1 Tax=Mycolicibacterium sarraceniae TaxID=1534348 RepID=UPI0013D6E110|nr:hypothetical protein [Mycolicibacterium sarraceniae]
MFALVEAVSARSSLVVKTTKNAALTAPLSIDPGDWLDEFVALMDRVRPRFVRCEPARHAAGLMLGLMSNLERGATPVHRHGRAKTLRSGFISSTMLRGS